jgi:hypothetical protein
MTPHAPDFALAGESYWAQQVEIPATTVSAWSTLAVGGKDEALR